MDTHKKSKQEFIEQIQTLNAQLKKSAKQLKPNIVIMDISMPNLNGFEATDKIRDQRGHNFNRILNSSHKPIT